MAGSTAVCYTMSTSRTLTGSQSTSSRSGVSAGVAANPTGAFIGTKPTLISASPMKFLIMDAPRQSNLHLYIKEMKRHSVTDVVRGCEECTYSGDTDLAKAGIELHDMAYDDGTSPPKHVISTWLELVKSRFFTPGKAESAPVDCAIAVHCVAGLGRAPVLVAIALIEFANYDPAEAVALIRKHRRGAINEKQFNYLEQYQRSCSTTECACVIM